MKVQNHADSIKVKVNMPIWVAVQELKNLYEALHQYGKNKNINIKDLMNASSVKDGLNQQGFDSEAAFSYLSSLAAANRKYIDIWDAPEGQTRKGARQEYK